MPYIARNQLPAQSGIPRMSVQEAGIPGQQVAQAAGVVTDFGLNILEAQTKARRAIELAKNNNAATDEINSTILALERDPDWANAGVKFDDAMKAIRKKYSDVISDDKVKQEFGIGFDRSVVAHRLEVNRNAMRKADKDAAATIDTTLETQANAAAMAPNPVAEQQARATAAKTLTDMRDAGLIDPARAVNELQRFNGMVDTARARSMITADPEAALTAINDPKMFQGLKPEQRASLVDQASRRAEHVQRARFHELERQDRAAEKRLKQQQEETSKTLWDRWAENGGRIDTEFVRSHKNSLNETDYKALLTASLGKEGRDEPDAIRELTLNVDSEQPGMFEKRAYNLLERGRIKLDTYRSMTDKSRTMAKDDQPSSPFKAGREYVKQILEPGQLGGDPAIRQPLAIAQMRALMEYDNWAEKNPGFTRTMAEDFARELTGKYQNVEFDKMRLSMPTPRGYSGSKQAVSVEDINEARVRIDQMLQSGGLSNTSAARELEMLEVWEKIIAKTPPRAVKK